MIADTLAKYINTSSLEVKKFLSMTGLGIHENPLYKELIQDIDVQKLHSTMDSTRELLDYRLPSVVDNFIKKYDLKEFPLSGFMVVNWVMGYLQYPEQLPNLLKVHSHFPKEIMKEAIPEVIAIFDELPEASEEWEKAFVTLVIPMIAR